MRIGLCLPAVMLVATLTMQPGFAEEAHSGAQAADGSKPSVDMGGSQPSSNESSQGAAKGSANSPDVGGVNSSDAGAKAPDTGKNSDPIDTRITVQPHRPGGKSGKAAEAKAKAESPALKNPHRRTFLASRTSDRTVRNAVGAPLAQHENTGRLGEHHNFPNVVPSPAAKSAVATAVAKPNSGLVRPSVLQLNASPTVTPISSNRGAVNGSNLGHPGSGPARIGGPAKTVVGISGTAIQSPH